ncbi:MAG TPA: hypothetical protein VK436_17300 [Methanocella sp.]|nr:hypothetical protein [Methanocella sp.]
MALEEPQRQKRRTQQSWKNNVERDLKRLLDRRGVIGAFLIAKNGETITQVFQDTTKQKESSLMQIVRKLTPLMQAMRNVPLRRTIFETKDGSIVFYSIENGMVGCLLDHDFDVVSIMLEVRTVGDMINSHLNNAEIDRKKQDSLLQENRNEFRAFNHDLLREIEKHFGPVTTEQIIQRTVR